MSEQQPPPQFAEYPRPHMAPGYERPPGIYFDAIGEAWTIFKNDAGTWILATLAMFLTSAILMVPVYALSFFVRTGGSWDFARMNGPVVWPSFLLSEVILIVGSAMIYPFYGALITMGARRARHEVVSAGDVFMGFKHFLPLVAAALMYSLATYVGLALLIVPGIFVMGAFSLCFPIIIEEGLGPVDAMKESWKRVGSNAWMMFVLFLVLGVLIYLSFCTCIGWLVTLPMSCIAVGIHYNYFRPRQAPDAQVWSPNA